ncbi:DUF262 domain-containing protein [uncultured Pseudodesulfovibrio sp.]|uniref:DUF262 domain-containing protein n=1 Tax=uncultured Pseudodesulfovibrio sp. TaxID=2035858 RepID=UPI0029C82AA0|nr:DUF262 domain-containing protein [uncultured Pseudodesulfovibrio sp.]
MTADKPIYEFIKDDETPDPDAIPIRDRRVYTQPYDLVVDSLVDQIDNKTIYLQPLSGRPSYQRNYVWTNKLASRLIESILLNVPIPPCYMSQNDEYELDVIDGQQRLYSIYRFVKNEFALTGLEVLTDLNGKRMHKLETKLQRKLRTHTLRLVAITNESHHEIKFDVFQRLNTNTAPLNAQELRNCMYRGALNDLLKEVTQYGNWLKILMKQKPDKRMRDEEIALRFFAFYEQGLDQYRTPQKHWLNDFAKMGMKYSEEKIAELQSAWEHAVDNSLEWFEPQECFRRVAPGKSKVINKALFDLTMTMATCMSHDDAIAKRDVIREKYFGLFENDEFTDLISRGVDHKKRTNRRFALWEEHFAEVFR